MNFQITAICPTFLPEKRNLTDALNFFPKDAVSKWAL
jgi:hypothetical protein